MGPRSGHIGIGDLPDELLLEIMRISPQREHAIFLRLSKKFYALGVTSLYRAIHITTSGTVPKITSTICEDSEKSRELALNVRCFEMVLNTSLPASHSPKAIASSLVKILASITNLNRLQLYAEGDSMSIFHNISYDAHSFPELKTLDIVFHPLDRYASTFFPFLKRHPLLETLIVQIHNNEHRRVSPHTFSGSIPLPKLRTCYGPLKVLKHLLPVAAPLLSTISLDLTELAGCLPGMVERDLEPLLKLSELRERRQSSLPETLNFRLVLSAFDIVITDAAFRFLPSDVARLSIHCKYVNDLDRKLRDLLDKENLKRFKSLKRFSLTRWSEEVQPSESEKESFDLLAKRLRQMCPSIEIVDLGPYTY
ncbi:hypothetical protein K435DRAFT_961930 [Dendrothele bispora CBS 962.96]|uniref:F-box domain-containing protein n=1 Tax=Dendrothele bispora (strain CBS 962.96) TaxID=1314807 RepID=A0A4S8MND1_DENBC|nr:hypothetical protein K435DRAFT_961930 [Dendrothele bispora CBS 962.96]